MIRVLIVSEIRLYGEGLAEILALDHRLEVVGTAADAEQAVRSADRHRPDALLLDLALTDAHRVVRAIASLLPECRVIALGVSDTESEVIAWAEAGVAGYVFRKDSVDELVTAVESAARRELRCSRRAAAALLRRVATLSARTHARPNVHLTPRETEIVRLLDQGLTNKQIAGRLYIELPTVKNHVHNILEKLEVHTRGEAAARVRDLGLLSSQRGSGVLQP